MMRSVDGLLRGEGRFAVGRPDVPWVPLLALLAICGWVQGATMGSFGASPLQALYSALKVPLLLAVASIVCLPSFYVLNTVLGLRDDFRDAMRGVVAAQATVAVALAALAPLIAFAYVSGIAYDTALIANGLAFAIAAACGQTTLQRHYRVLIARNPNHRYCRASWLGLYVFVAIQAAWVLRPFVGSPHLPTRFFREEAWSNAYVVVIRLVWQSLFGG